VNTKAEMFEAGCLHTLLWCELNSVKPPRIETRTGKPDFGVCAYYRDNVITIWIDSCAGLGRSGRLWSWPGYVVDRTPYGVLAHELGHHVEKAHGPRGGFRSHVWRCLDAAPLTGYCPNDNEWFAELFRLYVTNPDLLLHVRPKVADLFWGDWPHLAETREWRGVLAGSPRHIAATENKIRKVRPCAL
jgi:hypothetical protein